MRTTLALPHRINAHSHQCGFVRVGWQYHRPVLPLLYRPDFLDLTLHDYTGA
jgi:hypothetical protein